MKWSLRILLASIFVMSFVLLFVIFDMSSIIGKYSSSYKSTHLDYQRYMLHEIGGYSRIIDYRSIHLKENSLSVKENDESIRPLNHYMEKSHSLNDTSDFSNINSMEGKDLLSRIKKTDCRDKTCSKFLSISERRHQAYICSKKMKYMMGTKFHLSDYLHQETCVFIDGSGRKSMVLASFPGSGNTWLRGLIQQVTGLCTGSYYCDPLLLNSFPGEGIQSGAVLFVKTHKLPRKVNFRYNGGVFLVRNPFHAIVSEYTRSLTNSNHTGILNGKNAFGKNVFGKLERIALIRSKISLFTVDLLTADLLTVASGCRVECGLGWQVETPLKLTS